LLWRDNETMTTTINLSVERWQQRGDVGKECGRDGHQQYHLLFGVDWEPSEHSDRDSFALWVDIHLLLRTICGIPKDFTSVIG
jgi:hypothetical protein